MKLFSFFHKLPFYFNSSLNYVSVHHAFRPIRSPIFWIAMNNSQGYRNFILPSLSNTSVSSDSSISGSDFSDLPPLIAVESLDTQLLTNFDNLTICFNDRQALETRANILRHKLWLTVLTLESERVRAIIAINSITAEAIRLAELRIRNQIERIEEQIRRTDI